MSRRRIAIPSKKLTDECLIHDTYWRQYGLYMIHTVILSTLKLSRANRKNLENWLCGCEVPKRQVNHAGNSDDGDTTRGEPSDTKHKLLSLYEPCEQHAIISDPLNSGEIFHTATSDALDSVLYCDPRTLLNPHGAFSAEDTRLIQLLINKPIKRCEISKTRLTLLLQWYRRTLNTKKRAITFLKNKIILEYMHGYCEEVGWPVFRIKVAEQYSELIDQMHVVNTPMRLCGTPHHQAAMSYTHTLDTSSPGYHVHKYIGKLFLPMLLIYLEYIDSCGFDRFFCLALEEYRDRLQHKLNKIINKEHQVLKLLIDIINQNIQLMNKSTYGSVRLKTEPEDHPEVEIHTELLSWQCALQQDNYTDILIFPITAG